jgi:hypothetical protein
MKNLVMTFMVLFSFSVTASSQHEGFPGTWAGNWKGELQWFKTGDPQPRKVNMELRIAQGDSTGHFTWQIIYGSAAEDNRPYILKVKDAATGHWLIDERNGIVLDQFWVGNKFCGAFTVQHSTIVNNYRMENDQLVVEFYSIGAKPLNNTGNGTEESPRVDNYRINSYQKAVLSRVK